MHCDPASHRQGARATKLDRHKVALLCLALARMVCFGKLSLHPPCAGPAEVSEVCHRVEPGDGQEEDDQLHGHGAGDGRGGLIVGTRLLIMYVTFVPTTLDSERV